MAMKPTKIEKIEVRMTADLKRQATAVAQAEGDGDLSSWLRGLIRKAVAWHGFKEKR